MNFSKKTKKSIAELIVFAGIVLWAALNYTLFIDIIKLVFKLFIPLFTGIAIAFIINVPMKQIEKNIFKADKRKHKKLIRILSLIITIVLIISIIGLILFLIIPEIIEGIILLSKSLPSSINFINNLRDSIVRHYPDFNNYLKSIDMKNVLETTVGTTGTVINFVIAFLTSMISKLITLFIGFIISIYILADKENLIRQLKKILKAFLPEKNVKTVIKILNTTNDAFTKFLTGQCLDAILTGFLLFIILSIMKMPYALILGVLFAITALIPYIGAFITLAIGAILLGVINPIYALWYAIVFFLLQQFDDNFTYPRIVGGKVGLPPLWALLAVLVGGSLFGFVGMIISIPLASILYALLKDYVNERIENKENK
ncbi:MAG: AI-2E family transporter [Bacilli bacterium]|nr:AI-2E family transporter [Bacilli bacterium]